MDLIQDLKEKLKGAVFTTAEKKEGTKNLFIVSDETVDRQGETIAVDGWDLTNYKKNPILLWSHNPDEPAIGTNEVGYKTVNGKKRLIAKPSFHRKSELSRLISDLVEDGVIRGLSPGFLPKEYDDDGNYIKQELLEISFCNIPANPNALAMASAKGYDKKTLDKVFTKDKAWKYHKCKKCGFTRKVREGAIYKSMGCPSCKEKLVKSMKRFKRIKPMEIIDEKPFPNEHACRLVNPDKFDNQSFRSMKRDHNGKEYRVIMGKLKDSSKMSEQSYRYPKDTWQVNEAKSHCSSHNGISFEPASKSYKEQTEEFKKKAEAIFKGVIPYKKYGLDAEGEWDAGAEVKGASTEDLLKMCTWYDSAKPDIKSSYKLPHHKQSGYTTVWRGVAAAMAALLGARGGVAIPDGDRSGVYNHLVKHYKEFDKEAPELKAYTEAELAVIFDFKSLEIEDIKKEVKSIKESVNELLEGIKQRDKIIEENNEKVKDKFKKIRLNIEAKQKGIKVGGLEKRFEDIEANIKDLAGGLRSFTRGSGDGLGSRSAGDKAEEKKRNRRLINKALNLIVEASNKEIKNE